MQRIKEFYRQYRDYVRLDLWMYILMFLAIVIYALAKFAF